MRILKYGEQRDHDFKGTDVRGFRFMLEATAKAFSKTVANVRAAIDLSKIDLDVVLISGSGKRSVLVSGDLETLAMETNFNDNSFDFVHPDSTQGIDLLTGAADAYQKILLPIEVMLGQPINIRGGSILRLETRFGVGAVKDATVVDTSLITLYIEEMVAVGVQWITPFIEVHNIPQNQKEFKLALGENVTNITFINKDKDSVLLADQVIKDVRFKSDRYNATKDYYTLLTDRVDAEHHDYDAGHMPRNQSFVLFSGSEMDDAEITLNLDSANVNTNMNFIVVRKYAHFEKVVKEAMRRKRKHEQRLDKKLAKTQKSNERV